MEATQLVYMMRTKVQLRQSSPICTESSQPTTLRNESQSRRTPLQNNGPRSFGSLDPENASCCANREKSANPIRARFCQVQRLTGTVGLSSIRSQSPPHHIQRQLQPSQEAKNR